MNYERCVGCVSMMVCEHTDVYVISVRGCALAQRACETAWAVYVNLDCISFMTKYILDYINKL